MAIDIEKYRALLGQIKVQTRFKVNFSMEDTTLLLEETYKYKVAERRRVYESENTYPVIKKVAKWITSDLKPGLLLYGTVGSGKTTAADSLVTLIRTTNSQARLFRYTAIEISNAAKDDTELFESIKKSELLFIDDLGEEALMVKNYGNEVNPIIEILYYRYDKQKFTVVTTNKLEQEIADIYGVRIEDRFAEMFDRIYFNFPSFRRK